MRLMTQIGEDFGAAGGFEGDDMLDMQMHIGSYKSLQRRLSSVAEQKKTNQQIKELSGKQSLTRDELFGDLLP